MAKTVRVLIVDDSPTARQMLTGLINNSPDMRVIGEAVNGRQAVALAQELQPDVILMDLVMPEMDGLESTREIMALAPTPIVVVSASLEQWEADIAFQAISAGALTLRRKPVGPGDPEHMTQSAALLSVVRAMAEVRVIHHWRRAHQAPPPPQPDRELPLEALQTTADPEIVVIVSSTGGPAALSQILRDLPADFPLPIVVVQHIAPDFVSSLAEWLNHVTPLTVTIARENGRPEPGRVYLAPGDMHLRLARGQRFAFADQPDSARHIPSGDILFESVAESYGARAIGLLLTGMGSDGARGLHRLHQAGAFTIAQDEATSVVFGMPREAIALGAARRVLPLSDMPNVLLILSGREGIYHE